MVMAAFITPALTEARFSSTAIVLEGSFGVAQFSPASAPTPGVVLEGSSIRVQWPPVSFSGSSTVAYRVQRTTMTGATAEVCAGASVPAGSPGEVSCTDYSVQVGTAYTYAVQPWLLRDGIGTWSLPFGAASSPIAVPILTYAGASSVVDLASSGSATVPYPVGTEVGDLLVLVVVNGRNRAPSKLVDWTEVVSRGIGGSQDFHLFAAQRIADSAGSVIVDVDARSAGASAQVLRYSVAEGSGPPVLRASQTQSGVSATATIELMPTPDIITTASAIALSIVAVRAANPLSVASGSVWALRSVASSTPGTTSLAWALADAAVGSATSISSPTWMQGGTATRWIFGGSAFG